ncbi:FKBP-type peptidyl-prolyl cis-trans isomerase [Altererythrobacter lauratis]|uniref:Peptidyl-prolyl cis-trans isomerase n=1 Tax=Alteraurantiacibacter lauratis TaxID=2054627 RepID=A0ABV7EGH7_9SPHN
MKLIALSAALAVIALATPAAAQDSGPGAGMTRAEIMQSSAWYNRQQAALIELQPQDGWATLEGGVRFRRIAGDGTGPAPTVRDIVTVHYTGTLTNGTEFDSSRDGDPATFPLAQLVRGWQIAIPYMGVGDTAEIALPAELGYGARGAGPIPPGATLFFTIELLDVMVPPGR